MDARVAVVCVKICLRDDFASSFVDWDCDGDGAKADADGRIRAAMTVEIFMVMVLYVCQEMSCLRAVELSRVLSACFTDCGRIRYRRSDNSHRQHSGKMRRINRYRTVSQALRLVRYNRYFIGNHEF